jgi:hypothetical protein
MASEQISFMEEVRIAILSRDAIVRARFAPS